MFVSDDVLLEVSFAAAQARLANLARGGVLARVSEEAYGDEVTGLVRVGPLSSAPGVSRLVQVRFRDLVTREDSAVLTLRWEAIGPGGGLFPALDADITLTPAGEQATALSLAGAYRPPLGALGAGLDRAVLRRVATATTRRFLSRIADAIAHPAPAAAGEGEPPGLSQHGNRQRPRRRRRARERRARPFAVDGGAASGPPSRP